MLVFEVIGLHSEGCHKFNECIEHSVRHGEHFLVKFYTNKRRHFQSALVEIYGQNSNRIEKRT